MASVPDRDAQLVAWAEEAAPNEACGVLLPNGDAVRITNVSPDPESFFALEMDELVAVYEEHGNITGVWHSHPGGSPEPSETDRMFHPFGLTMLIVANGEVHDHS